MYKGRSNLCHDSFVSLACVKFFFFFYDSLYFYSLLHLYFASYAGISQVSTLRMRGSSASPETLTFSLSPQQLSPPFSSSDMIFLSHLPLPEWLFWILRAEDNLRPAVLRNVQYEINCGYLFFLSLISPPFTLQHSSFIKTWVSSEYQRIYECLWALQKDYKISCTWSLKKSKLRKERMWLLEAGSGERAKWENAGTFS